MKEREQRIKQILKDKAIIGNKFTSDQIGVNFTIGWLEKTIEELLTQEVDQATEELRKQLDECRELIKLHTHNITDNHENEWKVIEVSDLENILTQNQEQ